MYNYAYNLVIIMNVLFCIPSHTYRSVVTCCPMVALPVQVVYSMLDDNYVLHKDAVY